MSLLLKTLNPRYVFSILRSMKVAWLVLALCLSVTAILWQYTEKESENDAYHRFNVLEREAETAVRGRMLAYENLLRGGVGLFASSLRRNSKDPVTRPEWQAYVRSLDFNQSYPGVQGIGFSKRILLSEKDAHIRRIRAEGFPEYTVWPEGERPEYAPVVYLEPFSGRNLRAFGFDMLSGPVHREAMERARDTGSTAVSGKVKLVLETDEDVQSGFLMYLPIYRNGASVNTLEERRAALLGYVYCPFRMKDLMRGILGGELPEIDLEIFDGSDMSEKTLTYDADPVIRSLSKDVRPAFTKTSNFVIGGRTWTLFFASTPTLESAIYKNKPIIVLATGITISLLIFMVIVSISTTNQRAITLANDMTEELRKSEERYDLAMRGADDGVWDRDLTTNKSYIAPRFWTMLGYDAAEISDTYDNWKKLIHPEDVDLITEALNAHLEGCRPNYKVEYRILRKDGTYGWVLARGLAYRDGSGKPVRIVGSFSDITERKVAEEWRERLTEIIESASDFIGMAGAKGNLIYLNRAGRGMLGIGFDEDVSNIHIPDTHPDWANRLVLEEGHPAAIRDGAWVGETAFLTRDGREIPVSQLIIAHKGPDDKVRFFSTIARDITERKMIEEERLQLQAQMFHGQKLESLGVLAGGIAHDFNNLLMSIMGNAEMALMGLPAGSPSRAFVVKVTEVVKKASDLTKQMLAYSGKGRIVIENLDLSELVRDMAELLKVSINKNVTIRYNLSPNMPQVEADATQIRQVVMNLIINASDAIGDKQGVIEISTGVSQCKRNQSGNALQSGQRMPKRSCAYIDIADNGCGMDEETKAKIFDPFFTTKFSGRGLGLAAVLGIVRGHKGELDVYSKVGEGSTFRVLMPVSEKHVETSVAAEKKGEDLQGRGSILLVDDEEEILSVIKIMLEGKGFSVLTAKDGIEAVDLFHKHADEITAVVLDLTMPNMNGEAAFLEMKKIRGNVKAILCSGYNEKEIASRFDRDGFAGFLQKPFEFTDLLNKLRNVLA